MKDIVRVEGICTICWENSTKGSIYVDVCKDCIPLIKKEE